MAFVAPTFDCRMTLVDNGPGTTTLTGFLMPTHSLAVEPQSRSTARALTSIFLEMKPAAMTDRGREEAPTSEGSALK